MTSFAYRLGDIGNLLSESVAATLVGVCLEDWQASSAMGVPVQHQVCKQPSRIPGIRARP